MFSPPVLHASVPPPAATHASGRVLSPGLLALLLAYLTVTLLPYIHRLPYNHEEPRRAIVAQEMLLSGDYIGPTVFTRPYYKKPPLHNWLIALLAAPDGVVSRSGARAISIGAFLLLGLIVYRLMRPVGRRAAQVALLITLTNYLMLCEYANLAEPDMLFALFTFLAYALYIRAPLRPGVVLLSAACLGLGILTKGLSPLFFYPGVIVYALGARDARRRRWVLLGVHAVASVVLPGLWLLAMAREGHLATLLSTSASEVAIKTTRDLGEHLVHLLVFPPRVFVVLLPWSLLFLVVFRRVRDRGGLYVSSLWGAVLSVALLTLAAGSRDRYLIPAIPYIAVLGGYHLDPQRWFPRRGGVIVLAVLGLVCLGGGATFVREGYPWQSGILALTGVGALLLARRPQRAGALAIWVALIVLTFYEHGLYHHRTVYRPDYAAIARHVATGITDDRPVLLEERVNLIHLAVELEGILRRPVIARDLGGGETYYLITPPEFAEPAGREILRRPYPYKRIGEIVLARVGQPMDGEPIGSESAGPVVGGAGAHRTEE